MDITYLKVADLKPYPQNTKKHPTEQIEDIAESIKLFGFRQPIVVDKDYVIIIGHGRYLASKMLGLETVPCNIVTDLTDEQIRKLRIVDNKTNESDWDIDMLISELDDLTFDEFNFSFDEVPESDEDVEVVDDEYDVVIPEEPVSKVGDIYQLGSHRLMCGDSTSVSDVLKLVGNDEMDLLFTDPPYNVNVSNSEGMTIENDNLADSDFVSLLTDAFRNASNVLKQGGCFFVWHGDSERVNFQKCLEENGLYVKQCLIWVKNGFNFGRQDFKWQHEPCLYGWKEGAGHYFVFEFNHSTVIEDKVDLEKMKKEDLKVLCEKLLSTAIPSSVIHENKPLKNDLHPTMKPVVMCSDLIRYTTRKNDKVIDLFGGSGSTLIACEQLNRCCYMMEYDPHYVDVIIDRWEKFTGQKAVKLN